MATIKQVRIPTVQEFLSLPRTARRLMFRRYLKQQGVPRPVFAKVSAAREFKRLNFITFLEDLHNVSTNQITVEETSGRAL